MADKELEYRVKVDAGDASRDLRKFGRDAERAGRDVKDAFEDTSSSADKAAAAIREMGQAMDAELRGSAAAADALATALGPELTGRMDIDQAVADLQKMGLTFDDIRAEADTLATALRDVDGIRLQQINDGLDTTRTRMGAVRGESDQTRSVLANLAGNVSQDLGELGGVVGSLGVGIGQLAEYAIDGNIALSNLAKLAAPLAGMAAFGLAIQKVSQGMADLRAAQEAYTKQQDDFNQAVEESGSIVETLNEMLRENTELVAAPELNWWQDLANDLPFVGRAIDETAAASGNLTNAMAKAGITAEEWANALRVDLPGGAERYADMLQRINEASGLTTEEMDLLLEQFGLYGQLTANATTRSAVFATSLDGMNQALGDLADEQQHSAELWDVLLQDLADGSLQTEGAVQAWNRLKEILGLTDEEMAELTKQKLDEQLQADAEAADEAAGKILEMRDAIGRAQEAADEYNRTVRSEDWGAASLEAAMGVAEQFAAAGHADARMISDQQAAFDDLAESVEAAGEQLLNLSTPEGRASLTALDELGSTLVPEVAQAFDDSQGDIEAFGRSMDTLRQRTIRDLARSFIDLGDDEDVANQKAEDLVDQLSAIPKDIETFYRLAGDAEAKAKLELLQGSIDALPKDVQTTVTQQIILGDYQGALRTIQNYYDRYGQATVDVYANVQPALDAISRLRQALLGAQALANIAIGLNATAMSSAAPTPATVGLAATRVAPAAQSVSMPTTVTINAGVIGNRFEVERAVTRAIRGATRLAGRRAVLR